MKQRNKWKQHISVLLMVVMMLNMVFVAQAAGWKQEGEEWYFYDGNENRVTNAFRKSKGKWYYLGGNGAMVTNEFVKIDDGYNYLFYADEDGILIENKWKYIDGKWYHFGPVLEQAQGEDVIFDGGGALGPGWAEIHDKFYCFDKNHAMMSGFITDEYLDETFTGSLYFAFDDGALVSKRWLLLSDDGKECDHSLDDDCNCSWYFFKRVRVENGKLKGGAIMNGEQKALGDEGECYFIDGKMVANTWCEKECEEQQKHYYTAKGFRAVNKWLPINGYWYKFDDKGKVVSYAQIPGGDGELVEGLGLGTSSNAKKAPYRTVEEVNPVKDVVEVLVGQKEVTVDFQVKLASGSNAEYSSNEFTEDHDMWFKATNGIKQLDGKSKGVQVTDKKNGICTVTFNTGMIEHTDKIIVYIDDVKSVPVTVNTVLPKADTENEEGKNTEVKQAIDNILTPDENVSTTEIIDGLKNVYEVNKDEAEKHLLNKEEDLKNVEERHMAENKVEKEEPDVSEKVKDTVGKVDITGSTLNAKSGEKVQLKVDEPKDDWTLDENFTKTVALDIKLLVTRIDGENKELSELAVPVVITMKLPAGFTANGLKLFNLHGDEQTPVNFNISGGRISFITSRFSTYVFAQNEQSSSEEPSHSGGGGGGGSRSSVSSSNTGSKAGEWVQDAIGWWIRLNDGTYPVNAWMYLDYNGVSKWYHFNVTGYMETGWFTDVDGHKYYLNPVSDGTQGAMLTGWQFIDGFWYYFNPVSDGTQGALLVNTTTPDGYVVNENGQWIQ